MILAPALLRLRGCLAPALLLAATTVAAQDQTIARLPESVPESLSEIIVSGSRNAPPPGLDPIGYLQRHCFDANRLNRRSLAPVDDPSWQPLDSKTRAQFGIEDAATPAFGLVDAQRGHTLVIKFETILSKNGLSEQRCTLVVLGGAQHADLPDRISALFKGRGTQRHAGHRDGSETIAGWEQWLWTAMPGRRSKSWQAWNGQARGRTRDSWVVVADEARFFADHDYVLVDLKTRKGTGAGLSVITFSHTSQEQRGPQG